MMKSGTKLILFAFLFMTVATSIMAQNEPTSGTKSKHPINGYRIFLEGGLGFDEQNATYYLSIIQGGQIIPQLFVGGGLMINGLMYETPRSYTGSVFGVDYNEFIPFVSVRYDIVPRKVTPFIEGRLGYRLLLSKERGASGSSSNGRVTTYYEIEKADFGKMYLSPSVGVRVRHFNFALSLDIGSVSADVNGNYNKYHIEENILIPTARLSFDFGARR
ncbi:MAG: hypothetical protein IKR17_00415 [Bacteroidales bacterium]|nr:hypothetical protein [Bacteroidales bacterium]